MVKPGENGSPERVKTYGCNFCCNDTDSRREKTGTGAPNLELGAHLD